LSLWDEEKVSILFGLHRISPETHLVMFDRMVPQFLGWSLLPELWGTPHSSSPWSISFVRSCSEEGKVSIQFIFALLSRYSPLDVLEWGGCSSLGRIPSPRAAGTSLLLPAIDIDGI
jgi:hypothetical protein